MLLYKFTLVYSKRSYRDNYKATYFRACKYPKMTGIYKKAWQLLNSKEITSFSYGPFNTKL
jgi:hypothetical protein